MFLGSKGLRKSLGEGPSDIDGLLHASRGHGLLKENKKGGVGEEETIDGTLRSRFFISYELNWREKGKPERVVRHCFLNDEDQACHLIF